MKKCPQCGSENRDQARFCVRCRAPLPVMPAPQPGMAVITPENAFALVPIRRLGNGEVGRDAVYSPDGRLIAVASAIGVWVYDETLQRTRLALEVYKTNRLAFNQNGQVLAGACEDWCMRWWGASNGALLRRFLGEGIIWPHVSVAFHPDGERVATGDSSRRVQIWRDPAGKPAYIEGLETSAWGLAFSPDGEMLAGNDGSKVGLWDKDGNRLAVLEGHSGNVVDVAFSPDGRLLVSASDDKTMGV